MKHALILLIMLGLVFPSITLAADAPEVNDTSIARQLTSSSTQTIHLPNGDTIQTLSNPSLNNIVSVSSYTEKGGQTSYFQKKIDQNGNNVYNFGNGSVVTCTPSGDCTNTEGTSDAMIAASKAAASYTPFAVIVTETIPGAECTCIDNKQNCTDITTRKYQCIVTPGVNGFALMVQSFTKWFMNIAILVGVLVIAAFGVAWSVAGDNDAEYKKKLKGWAINIIIGLAILFFFSYILRFFAPQIFV